MIGAVFVATAFRDGFGAFHHQLAAHGAEGAGRLGLDDVFALGIIAAAVEYAIAAALFHHRANIAEDRRPHFFGHLLNILVSDIKAKFIFPGFRENIGKTFVGKRLKLVNV